MFKTNKQPAEAGMEHTVQSGESETEVDKHNKKHNKTSHLLNGKT